MAAHTSVPDWVHPQAGQGLQSADPEVKAVVLLDEQKFTVMTGDDVMERHRRVVKILRKEGRDEGELAFWLHPHDKVVSIHAWSFDSSGRTYELKEQDFTEKTPYSFELYDDVHLRSARAPAAQPGSLIAFEYEIRRRKWFHELSWFFQEENPVQEARCILQMPVGWEYKDFWTEKTPVHAEPSPEGGWEWTVLNVPGIKEEPRMPAFLSLSSRMQIAYFEPGESIKGWASWDAVGRWYSHLTDGRRAANPEITRKAAELTAGKNDFDAKVRALATFVQSEVRYVAIEIGIGGFQPHAANDIFRLRYGDCKDKATVLSSLLQEVGIHSEYVLIHTERGVVSPDVPSPMFNHVILAIELPRSTNAAMYQSVVQTKSGKRYLIFDPTDEEMPLGALRSELQANYGLLVSENGGELIRTPVQAPEFNALVREGHFVLNADSSLQGEILEKRTGDHASYERYSLKTANQQQREQHEEGFLNRSLQGFTVQNLEVKELENRDKDLLIRCQITVPQYGKLQGPLMLLRPRILGEKAFWVDQKPRHFPIEMNGTSHEVDTFEIQIPEGYKVDDVPERVKIDAGFASYSSKTEVSGNKSKYTREYTVKELRVAAERLSELRAFEGRIGADEVAAVVLMKTQ